MSFPSNLEINQLQLTITSMRIQNWLGEDLFRFQWWLLVGILIIPWIVWVKMVDRTRIFELLAYGFLFSIITGLVDAIGIELGLFIYPYKLMPIVPRLLPAVFGLVPVSFMLLYQFSDSWRSFIINNIIFGAVAAFILQPIAKYLGMYQMLHWSYFYSFVVYILAAVSLRWLNLRFKALYTKKRDANLTSDRMVTSPAFKKRAE
ncbi:MAG TPA: CBO0543 family protein [Syntrophomonadaceae bacterium]|nr:CBO0543 family protein [Syntrophomonadaceae bacterium]